MGKKKDKPKRKEKMGIGCKTESYLSTCRRRRTMLIAMVLIGISIFLLFIPAMLGYADVETTSVSAIYTISEITIAVAISTMVYQFFSNRN